MQQKSIEQFFHDYQLEDPDVKAKLLPEITEVIYERNMDVVRWEKADTDLRKKQLEEGVSDYDNRIHEIIQDYYKEQNMPIPEAAPKVKEKKPVEAAAPVNPEQAAQ